MNKISSKHFIFLLLAVTMIAMRSYSSIFINKGGRDTWLLIIISYTLTLLLAIFILKRYINLGMPRFFDLLNAIKPKLIGKILLIIFCLGLFINAIEATSVEVNSIHVNFFIETPQWYCLLFFLIPAAYAISRNFNTILITCVVTMSFIILGDIIFLVVIAKHIDFSNLLPIFESAPNINCILQLIGASSCMFITLPFLHFITKPKGLIRDTVIATIIAIFFISTAIICLIGYFGYNNASNIYYPEYMLCQQIEIGNFLEFGELFLIFRSTCVWFLKYILCSLGILFAFKDIIKNKAIFICINTILIFIISYILTQNQLQLFNALNYIQYINIFTLLVVPVISVILIRNNKIDINA